MRNNEEAYPLCIYFTFGFATATHAQQVNTLLTKRLPEAPGKEIEVITVNYAPGAVDVIHRHDAHTVAYVLEGEVEMQVRGGMLQRLGPGAGILRIT
jgi:quercetin dioxygenase-like cupin family protein